MSEYFLSLSRDDQREVLEIASAAMGRPAHLLEKDVWVVWALSALYAKDSPLEDALTFKGGTSLSKVYRVIDRFSEDIDLTYDIRRLIPDLTGESGELPASSSQARKWTRAVRERLPGWIASDVQPVMQAALTQAGLDATLVIAGKENEKLLLCYPPLKTGTGYVKPEVALEFGARSTGEPHAAHAITCDMAGQVADVLFPIATPLVMSAARTFWEKATAAHVFCAQGRIRGERYARHWHDLIALSRSPYFQEAVTSKTLPLAVAQHKSFFFSEKDADGQVIDYVHAVGGNLRLAPTGPARDALAEDYALMVADDVMVGNALAFDDLMQACSTLEQRINNV